MKLKTNIYLLSGVRTAIGKFGGVFKDSSALELGVKVAKEAIKRAEITEEEIQEVIFGHCMPRSDELNIARSIGLACGIPYRVPGITIQRQCASSMEAIVIGAQKIVAGEIEVALVGGVETMSRVPYVLKDYRFGKRLWDGVVTDALIEGLKDPIGHFHMGITAENLAEEFNISREEQDYLAYLSHKRAIEAIKKGKFKEEIVAMEVVTEGGNKIIVDRDEHPREDTTLERLALLKPVFKDGGTVTAGNSAGINDGAAAVVIASERFVEKRGVKPIARLVGHAVSGVEPERMGLGPVFAINKLLGDTGCSLSDIELIELNEAFAAQYLACERLLNLDRSITNVNGSGISLGHPVGATGCRLVVTLVHEMIKRGAKLGLAALCVGGGMGKATLWELVS